jgi:7,8-dihydropterin-6-yl-methyl-4-(beta-D-ribofuranosyl)aminobenzene 5'-phosphate synthase
VNIKILYDNQAENGFLSGWGFSALVDGTTLFDVGERVDSLRKNMAAFGVDPQTITRVVLSHEHWDHVGGIGILADMKKVHVYLPAAFTDRFKQKIPKINPNAIVVEVDGLTPMGNGLYATPQLNAKRWEISLAIEHPEGIVLIVGCSHPGLDRILEEAKKLGPIQAIIGGFHGFKKLEALDGIPVLGPTHCTRKKKAIRKLYPAQTHLLAAGMEMDL